MKDVNQTERLFDEIFKESLENASTQVPPGVWEGISGSVAGSSAAAGVAVKTAIWMKVAIAAGTLAAIGAVSYFILSDKPVKENQVQNELPSEQSIDVDKLAPTEPTIQKNIKVTDSQIQEKPDQKGTEVKTDKTSVEGAKPKIIAEEEGITLPERQFIDANFEFDPQPIIDYKQNEVEKESQSQDPVNENETKVNPDEQREYTYVRDSSYFFIPNTVTPNGDGYNDVYEVKVVGEESFEIVIFSSDNQILYRSKNKYQSWNCKLPNGEEAPAGTYYVVVYLKFKDMEMDKKVSKLNIIK